MPGVRVEPWQIEGAQLVGNYALSFRGADGHEAGIYTWPLLCAFCPCDRCEADAAAARDVFSA